MDLILDVILELILELTFWAAGVNFGLNLELTFWTAGVNFGLNLELTLGLILGLKLDLTFNPPTGVNFAGVIFLTLIDAQGVRAFN